MARATTGTLDLETFEGVPGGMNLALPPQELSDSEARYLQDVLLDYPGLTRRRGPMQPLGSAPTFSDKFSDMFYTYDPGGTVRIGALTGDNTKGSLEAITQTFSSKNQIPWGQNLPSNPPTQPYVHTDIAPALNGGVFIGTTTKLDSATPSQCLALWRGGINTNYTTGTISTARGSSTVVGSGTSWLANASPGMFLFANTDDPYTDTYIGTVLTVLSDTSLTLETVSPHPITNRSYTLRALRGPNARVTTGRITCGTAAATVTGGQTKFIDQGMNSGVWQIYRASDWAFVGKVSTVTTNISITLTANAAVAMANERFIGFKVDSFANEYSLSTLGNTRKPGFVTSVYAERQWYANNGSALNKTSRIWFSDTNDPEALDLSTYDGNFLDIGSTRGALQPIQKMQAAYNALLVFKESETYGIFGTSPTNFQVRKLADDGVLQGGSVQPWGGGVIWAGREGINFFDGINVTNLAQDKLGDYWRSSARTFDPSLWRMWSTVVRDHYLLFIDKINPTVPVVKGTVSTELTKLTVVINMNSRAFSMFTNVGFRGAIQLPLAIGGDVFFAVNGTFSSANRGWIVDASNVWDAEGLDTLLSDGENTLGPDFYMESKKFAAGDSLRKKLFKQLAIYYICQGGSLKVDTVVGLNNIGKTSATEFPATAPTWDMLGTLFTSWDALGQTYPSWDDITSALFEPKRIKFLKRSQHLAFRIWQESNALTRVRLGPYQIGYKLQRPGRI